MAPFRIIPAKRARGEFRLPGDKSIIHRALIISALAEGNTLISNFTPNNDCLATLDCLKSLGVRFKLGKQERLTVFGRGLYGLKKPSVPLFCRESGTTMRLLAGLLSGQLFSSRLIGSPSLNKRPMSRVTLPLRMMGAQIYGRTKGREEFPPLLVCGGNLEGIKYCPPVASAQVKSALLLAGLFAEGVTCIREPVATRDHTERMLRFFGVPVKRLYNSVSVKAPRRLASPGFIRIPGDISSASFFLVLGSILPGSELCLQDVSLNPSRASVIRVLKRMGADLSIRRKSGGFAVYEPSADIIVRSSSLRCTRVPVREIPSLIDEIPVLMVAACYARGTTVFPDIGELRVKETDRIFSMSKNLNKMGARIKVRKTGSGEDIIVEGVGGLKGAGLKSFGDHRTAMSLVIAALCAQGQSTLDDVKCIAKSFPGFLQAVRSLVNK